MPGVPSKRKRSSNESTALYVAAKREKMTQAAEQEAQIAQVAAENEAKIVLMRAEFDAIMAKNAADLVAVNAQHAAEVAQHAAEVIALKAQHAAQVAALTAQNTLQQSQLAKQTGMFGAWGSLAVRNIEILAHKGTGIYLLVFCDLTFLDNAPLFNSIFFRL